MPPKSNSKSQGLTLSQAQDAVDQWIQSYGVRYFSEMTNLAILMEEVGELARLFAMKFGEKSPKKAQTFGTIDLQSEMGDVLFVLVCLANQTGISLEEALQSSLAKNTERDKDRHKSNPKLQ